MSRYEIRYAAVGGQGLVTAGTLLMGIAVEKENKHAVESPTITAAVRGGSTKVDVIISDEKILYPQATAIDFFVCTFQKPYDQFRDLIKDDAVVVLDTHLVPEIGDTRNWKLHQIPMINETKLQLGNIVLTSVVTLAVTQELTGIVEYENLESYIKEWAPRDFLELNLKAIEVGRELARRS
jgi:2-oxoglutarate ferredoxin oxidoreductase subunit gamma